LQCVIFNVQAAYNKEHIIKQHKNTLYTSNRLFIASLVHIYSTDILTPFSQQLSISERTAY